MRKGSPTIDWPHTRIWFPTKETVEIRQRQLFNQLCLNTWLIGLDLCCTLDCKTNGDGSKTKMKWSYERHQASAWWNESLKMKPIFKNDHFWRWEDLSKTQNLETVKEKTGLFDHRLHTNKTKEKKPFILQQVIILITLYDIKRQKMNRGSIGNTNKGRTFFNVF